MSKEKRKLEEMLATEVNPRNENVDREIPCSHCGKIFVQSPYSALCGMILKHKPVCSYECNKALGQVK